MSSKFVTRKYAVSWSLVHNRMSGYQSKKARERMNKKSSRGTAIQLELLALQNTGEAIAFSFAFPLLPSPSFFFLSRFPPISRDFPFPSNPNPKRVSSGLSSGSGIVAGLGGGGGGTQDGRGGCNPTGISGEIGGAKGRGD